jgi:hypothetical protein
MATLATLYDRLLGRGGAQAEARPWSEQKRPLDYRLRPFPNEDVHLFVKRIDNSRVIRAADPQTPRVCWKLIGAASTSAVLLIGMLLPSGYRLMAGYQIEELKKQNDELIRQKSELEVAEAKLLSPDRLAELARLQEFVDPDPSRVVHLAADKPVQTMAMRRPPVVIKAAPAQSIALTQSVPSPADVAPESPETEQ